MSRLSQKDAKLVEAVLEGMAEELAELATLYNLGSCTVRVLDEGHRVTLVGRAHERSPKGLVAPTEVVGFRETREG